jgi:protein-S-isoprenylcysteine O-methyltransferase Ste14
VIGIPVDRFRYFFAVFNLIVLPSGVLFWLLIHSWASHWRRLGAFKTYLIVLLAMVGVATLLYRFRKPLLGTDLGTHWILIVAGILFYLATLPLERQYWKHISISTLAGVPEVSRAAEGRGSQSNLIREGIYGVIRHPRYASAGLGVLGNILLINYTGLYILGLLLIPLGWVLLELEERELVARFGEPYREYQRQVPRLIPDGWPHKWKIPSSPK